MCCSLDLLSTYARKAPPPIAPRDCSERVREGSACIGVLARKIRYLDDQRITIKKQAFRGNDLRGFLCMGKCRNLGSLKNHSWASQTAQLLKKKKKRKENPTANAGRHQGCEFNPWGQVDPLEKGMKHFLWYTPQLFSRAKEIFLHPESPQGAQSGV